MVVFDRPAGERLAPPDAGADDTLDSDPGPLTGRVTVTLYDDHNDIDERPARSEPALAW